jgi:23S rRNA C2498 (ribose-2'-O)-methylase RlmM
VGSFVSSLRIRALKNQIEALRQRCHDLAVEFETVSTSQEKARIAREYDKALKKVHAMQFLLDLQERKEQEAAENAKTGK